MGERVFRRWLAGLLAGFAVLLGTAGAGAQPGVDASPRGRVIRAFEANSPALGELLPDVPAYDADGNVLRLSSLKGSYTVLVFGCLT